MYTCHFEAYRDGKSCFDPLFYHYPTLNKTYDDIESTFLVADALKVSPVLSLEDSQKLQFWSYFPPGKWLSMKDFSVL